MAKCGDCGTALPADARFCPGCGAPAGVKKDVYQVSAEGLVGKVKEVIREAGVKRIVVKDEKGKVLLSIPVMWGAAGTVAVIALAPWLAALGVIAGIVTKCTVEVESRLASQPPVTMTFMASLASCAHLMASDAFLMSNRCVMSGAMSSRFSVISFIARFVSTSDAA